MQVCIQNTVYGVSVGSAHYWLGVIDHGIEFFSPFKVPSFFGVRLHLPRDLAILAGFLGKIRRVLSVMNLLLQQPFRSVKFDHLLIKDFKMACTPNSDSETDDEEDPTENKMIKGRLLECLDAAASSGTFAFGEQLKNAPNPGLVLEGYGAISFPLDADNILMIKTASVQGSKLEPTPSPLSQGVWEIPWYKWKVENPSWTGMLNNIKRTICAELGMSRDLQLRPLSIVFHEEGSTWKPFQR